MGLETASLSEHPVWQRLRAEAPLTLDRYMELCLSDAECGYYRHGAPLGRQGDFITAPEISQMFGELLGLWCAEQWRAMGAPDRFLFLELGPGRGTLLQDMLRATQRIAGFHAAMELHLVEIHPGLESEQRSRLAAFSLSATWHQTLENLPPLPILFIGNELLDTLPIKHYVYRPNASISAWCERWIDIQPDGSLHYTHAPHIASLPDYLMPEYAPKSLDIREFSPQGVAYTTLLAQHCVRYGGAGLWIDYGYHEAEYGDSFQALSQHRYVDPLLHPGVADLTAHVDFSVVRHAALAAGCDVYGPTPQGIFLEALGIRTRAQQLQKGKDMVTYHAIQTAMERLILEEHMGVLFKVLALTAPSHPQPEGFVI